MAVVEHIRVAVRVACFGDEATEARLSRSGHVQKS